MDIKILGPGCARCHSLENLVRETVAASPQQATIEKVDDFGRIAGYGIMATPGLVIDGQVVSSGRVPSKDEIAAWIGSSLNQR